MSNSETSLGECADDNGRRERADRRVSNEPFAGPDRRKADRRSGSDRRAAPRS